MREGEFTRQQIFSKPALYGFQALGGRGPTRQKLYTTSASGPIDKACWRGQGGRNFRVGFLCRQTLRHSTAIPKTFIAGPGMQPYILLAVR